MQKLIKIIPAIALIVSVAGCTGMNGNFGCNATAGDSCSSVSEINAKADAGYYANQNSASQPFSYKQTNTSPGGYQGVTPLPGEPVRFGERVQRIWLAPYQDSANNYHEPSYVYTVLQQPHWLGLPANEIDNSETDDD